MDSRLIYRNILLENQFRQFFQECLKAGIDICPLKGMGLLLSGHYGPGERDMEDIDVLVRKKDLSKLNKLLRENNYYPVRSGEPGYHRKGEPAVIDIHTDILYMKSKQLKGLWNKMVLKNNLKFLPDEEHFIYIIFHSFVQHGYLSKTWCRDLEKVKQKIKGKDLIRERAESYGLGSLLCLYDSLSFPRKNNIKSIYLRFIINLPYFPDKGHFLRPLFAGGIKEKIKFFFSFMFPSLSFLKRRYRFRPPELLLYIRPFLLFFKIIKSPLYS